MSRDINWLDRDYQESEDVSQIIEDGSLLVDVYRDHIGGDVGFDDVFEDQVRVRSIIARIDKLKPGFNRNPNEAGTVNNHLFIGTTKDRDVRNGDIWKVDGKEFKVTSPDTVGQPYSEVQLEIQL